MKVCQKMVRKIRLNTIEKIKSLLKAIIFPFIIYKKNDKKIYLTFDDGPTPHFTPKIIRILNELEIKATFFLEGKKADLYPEIVRSLIQNGHSIGYHTYYHKLISKNTWAELKKEYKSIEQFYSKYYPNSSNKMLRPPYGGISLKALLFFYLKNIKIVMWSRDSRDSLGASETEILKNLNFGYVKPGEIILFHDDRGITADLLQVWIGALKKSMMTFGKL